MSILLRIFGSNLKAIARSILILCICFPSVTVAADENSKPVHVLVLEGGGIYGVLSTSILVELERKTQKPLSEVFDVMVGTSTGAIQIALLNIPKPNTHEPKYSAEVIHEFYINEGSKALHISWLQQVKTLAGLIAPILSPEKLHSILTKYIGDAKLQDSLSTMIIPIYDLNTTSGLLFKSNQPPFNAYSTAEALMAATAIPNVIPAYPMKIRGETHYLTDATVLVNNPTGLAILEAGRLFPGRPLVIVSIGSGKELPPSDPKKIGHQGLLHMMPNWLSMIYQGRNHTMKIMLYQAANHGVMQLDKFYHIDPPVSIGRGSPLDVSPRNIALLKYSADSYIKSHQHYFDVITDSLLANLVEGDVS